MRDANDVDKPERIPNTGPVMPDLGPSISRTKPSTSWMPMQDRPEVRASTDPYTGDPYPVRFVLPAVLKLRQFVQSYMRFPQAENLPVHPTSPMEQSSEPASGSSKRPDGIFRTKSQPADCGHDAAFEPHTFESRANQMEESMEPVQRPDGMNHRSFSESALRPRKSAMRQKGASKRSLSPTLEMEDTAHLLPDHSPSYVRSDYLRASLRQPTVRLSLTLILSESRNKASIMSLGATVKKMKASVHCIHHCCKRLCVIVRQVTLICLVDLKANRNCSIRLVRTIRLI